MSLWNLPLGCQTISLLRVQIGWENFAHQDLVFGMDSHSLIEVAYMLNGVCLAIIHGESGLIELLREFYSLNPTRER